MLLSISDHISYLYLYTLGNLTPTEDSLTITKTTSKTRVKSQPLPKIPTPCEKISTPPEKLSTPLKNFQPFLKNF